VNSPAKHELPLSRWSTKRCSGAHRAERSGRLGQRQHPLALGFMKMRFDRGITAVGSSRTIPSLPAKPTAYSTYMGASGKDSASKTMNSLSPPTRRLAFRRATGSTLPRTGLALWRDTNG
jgi:hypothetical protein